MKLTLDRIDLKPEHEDIPCSATRFAHFNKPAQQAIITVGKATFVEWDGRNYNVIYPPKS